MKQPIISRDEHKKAVSPDLREFESRLTINSSKPAANVSQTLTAPSKPLRAKPNKNKLNQFKLAKGPNQQTSNYLQKLLSAPKTVEESPKKSNSSPSRYVPERYMDTCVQTTPIYINKRQP